MEAVEPRATALIRREGEYWSIEFEGDAFRLRDSKGLRYLSHLLMAPGREIHALELVAAVEGHTPGRATQRKEVTVDVGDAGELLDEHAKAEYRTRLIDLEAELSEAEEWNDPERAARLREELDFLARELAGAVGLGGRDRMAGSNSERGRERDQGDPVGAGPDPAVQPPSRPSPRRHGPDRVLLFLPTRYPQRDFLVTLNIVRARTR